MNLNLRSKAVKCLFSLSAASEVISAAAGLYVYLYIFITWKNDSKTSVLASVLSQDRVLELLSLTAVVRSWRGAHRPG